MRTLAILLSLLLIGCVKNDGAGQARRKTTAPPAAAQVTVSPWLNPRAQIASIRRAAAPHQMDIRQALFFGGQAGEALLRLRDYSAKGGGQPDPQHLMLLQLDAGTSSECELGENLAIVELLASPSKDTWLVTGLDLAAGGSPADAPLRLICSQAEFSAEAFVPDQRLLPLGFQSGRTILARPVKSIQVDNGLATPALDWKSPAQCYDLSTQQLTDDDAGLFVLSPDGSQLAGYQVDYTPVLPADSQITYFAAGAAQASARRLAQFGYHVSYTAFQWRPPLVWLGDDVLATVQFLPDTAGISAKPNHLGLFRLVTLDPETRHVTLIEDHLPADLPIAADSGVLFYTLQQLEQGEARWGLWAASDDGLLKQRLWQPDKETVYLSVEDAANGRLLVNHQYFESGSQRPQLISELREFSLEPLAGGEVKLELASPEPLPPVQSSPEQPESSEPPAGSTTDLPPLGIPD